MIRRIVSGGQTGADRAALDVALTYGIETGGYVPKRRMAEDGTIPQRYSGMIETNSENPALRTEMNVIHSDGTLLISHGSLAHGSLLTQQFAAKHRRPWLHLNLESLSIEEAAAAAEKWIKDHRIEILNAAGPRASEDQEIYEAVRRVFTMIIQKMV